MKDPPTTEDWVHEVKFDGYRMQVRLDYTHGKAVTLMTRSGQNWTDRYPEIAQALKGLSLQNAILDGEVVALDEQGRSHFQLLQQAMKDGVSRNLCYYAFDLLFLDGEDLRELPLIERKEKLKRILSQIRDRKIVRYSDHLKVNGSVFLELACKEGLEGIVSKNKESTYESRRNGDWVKSKCVKQQEFVIGGYTDPQGSRKDFGSLLLGVNEGSQLRYVGKCGTGFDAETLGSVFQKLKRLKVSESPFQINSPRERGNHWLKPKLVAEVSFAMWTQDGLLRAPVFRGLREDKKVNEVNREDPSDLKITNPDKVFFKPEKITKLDIFKFYSHPLVKVPMSSLILGRPLSVRRCPDGVMGECFFQKHLQGKGVPGLRNGKGYIALDSSIGLSSLVQMGAFEIHTWGCHEKNIEHPDEIVFDFDPSPEVSFSKVKEAAVELKDLLEKVGLISFLKLSGGKGLHVHVPIAPIYSWQEVKAFSRVIAGEMVNRKPDRYIDTQSKEKRKGKIFIDFFRNEKGSTSVAPYSIRALPRSSVAMPIEWSELKKMKSASHFNLKSALVRLKARRKDPWDGYLELKQTIEILSSNRKRRRSEIQGYIESF